MAISQIPEVREADAPAEVRKLYADIRATVGIPFVSLVYRYLATVPDALEYAWAVGRPPMLDGRMDRWAAALMDADDWPKVSADARTRLVGSAGSNLGRAQVRELISYYNRANIRNLVLFSALLELLERLPSIVENWSPPPFEPCATRAPALQIPLPKFQDLNLTTQNQILELANAQGHAASGIIPSLYLNLAPQPKFLGAVHAAILPLLADGRTEKPLNALKQKAAECAASLAADAATPMPASIVQRRHEIFDVLTSFTADAMPQMVVNGRLLTDALS